MLHNAVAARAPSETQIRHDHPDGLTDSDGGDGEVRSSKPEGGQPDNQRSRRRGHRGNQKREERVQAGIHRQGGGVRSNPVEDCKPKRDLTGESSQYIPGDAGGHPKKSKKKQPDDVRA